MWGFEVCWDIGSAPITSCLRFKQLADFTTDGSKGTCPHVTATLPFPASIVVFFPPVEFFGNFTTCSTLNKFSTWTMGDLRQGMDSSLYAALLWSLKKTPSFVTFGISWLFLPTIPSSPPLTLALVLIWEVALSTLSLKEVLMSEGNYDSVIGRRGRSHC